MGKRDRQKEGKGMFRLSARKGSRGAAERLRAGLPVLHGSACHFFSAIWLHLPSRQKVGFRRDPKV